MRGMGIAEAVATAIMECPQKYRQQLANNIVLTGGNVNMPGFAERVENDVKKLLPERYSVKVYKPDKSVLTISLNGFLTVVFCF